MLLIMIPTMMRWTIVTIVALQIEISNVESAQKIKIRVSQMRIIVKMITMIGITDDDDNAYTKLS